MTRLKLLYNGIVWGTFCVAILILGLRWVTPHFMPPPGQLSAWLEKELQIPVKITESQLTWGILNPQLELKQVALGNDDIAIKKVSLSWNVFQLLFKRWVLDSLVFEGVALGLRYQDPGILVVSQLPALRFDLNNTEPQKVSVKKLIIKNSDIQLELPNGSLPLSKATISIENKNTISIRAQGLAFAKSQIQVAAELDKKNQGKIFLHWQGDGINQLWDLTSNLFNVPYALKAGNLDLNAWFEIKNNHLTHFSSSLKGQKIKIAKALKETFIEQLSGTFGFKQTDSGWKLSAKDLKIEDFSPIELVVDHQLNQSVLWEVFGKNVEIKKWMDGLSQADILPEKIRTSYLAHQPEGFIEYLHVKCRQVGNTVTPLLVDLVFRDAKMKTYQSFPGLSTLRGALHYEGGKGSAIIQSHHLRVEDPHLFSTPILLENAALYLNWEALGKNIIIKAPTIQGTYHQALLQGEGRIEFPESGSPLLDIYLELGSVSCASALKALPSQILDKELKDWLETGIVGGKLSARALFRGNLNQFPFDHQEGVFQVLANIDGLNLHYAKHWPQILDSSAQLLFHQRAMEITLNKGTISEGKINQIQAHIENLSEPELIVQGELIGNLPDGVRVLQKSSLQNSIGASLASLNLDGPMTLWLTLQVPLHHLKSEEIHIQGEVNVQNASLMTPLSKTSIDKIKGRVSFTENSVSSEKLTGNLFESLTQFTLGKRGNNFEVQAKGRLNTSQLKQATSLNELPVEGSADYTATLLLSSLTDEPEKLQITSQLKGIAIDAPEPLSKKTNEEKLFNLNIDFKPNQLLHATVGYGDVLNAKWNISTKNNQFETQWAIIHFGNEISEMPEANQLQIVGKIESIDYTEWKNFLSQWKKSSENKMQNLLIPNIDLKIGKLSLFGLIFTHTEVKASQTNSEEPWNLHLDGPQIKGFAKIPLKEDGSVLIVDLQKLNILRAGEMASRTEYKEPYLHPIDIKIKELEWDKKNLTDIQARLEPSWKGFYFPNVLAKSKSTDIQLSGGWDYLGTDQKFHIEGKVVTYNIGDTLDLVKETDALNLAKGVIHFSGAWHGSPFKIDYPTLGGQADFTLNDGIIQGVNPGFGRILSILNLDTVKRRLNLDFSDITKNGLAFDTLTGKLQFAKGIVSSNKIFVKGPSVKIEIFGETDLEKQQINGEMIVMPNVTGSLPVAAAIAAGNPAIGAAVWAADKLLGKKIQEINRSRYKLLGTWQAPLVQEMNFSQQSTLRMRR